MRVKFTKMHGAGNDFIFINGMKDKIPLSASVLQKICHRRFGIGCDQLFVILPAKNGNDFRTEIYNQDGSQIEMCGNGIRCFVKYVRDNGLTNKTKIAVETLAGVIVPEIVAHAGTTKDTVWVK